MFTFVIDVDKITILYDRRRGKTSVLSHQIRPFLGGVATFGKMPSFLTQIASDFPRGTRFPMFQRERDPTQTARLDVVAIFPCFEVRFAEPPLPQ